VLDMDFASKFSASGAINGARHSNSPHSLSSACWLSSDTEAERISRFLSEF
jgi:hypothetical protein